MLGIKTGKKVIELAETDSTNSYASRLLHMEIPEEGTVIMAGFQKAGKGQRGSGWESEEGKNLLLSYIFYPRSLKVTDQFILNQAIALGVYDFIRKWTGVPAAIKWPNDIIAGNSKIAGILIENSIRSTHITHSIAGIGINVNQLSFDLYQPPATSLQLLENREFNLKECLISLNICIDKWYSQVALSNFKKINECYLDAMFLRGKPSRFEQNGVEFIGTIQGVNPDGKLHIVKEDGDSLLFFNKEVKYLF